LSLLASAPWREETLRRIVDFVLRIFSYLYTAGSSLGLLGLGIVSKASGDDLAFQCFSWKGSELTTWLIGLGLAGLLSAAAGALGKGSVRWLLPLWNLVYAILMVRGHFLLPGKSFESVTEFQLTIAYTAGAIGSLLASLLVVKKKAKA
jgi:hypothetical protein